ncbi:hypothetical protein [Streptomyces sp. NPDC059994]|uniref:hypothetical protein n=1 Tax=Streptomyces sp. NPDC059994 TaxID=3347029 RepID=UPI0036BF9415
MPSSTAPDWPQGTGLPPLQQPTRAHVRIARNLEAIRLLTQLPADQPLTHDQREALQGYSWGATGVSEVFNEARPEYQAIRTQLRELLSDAAYDAAAASTPTAHYTDPAIVEVIRAAVTALNVPSGARLLELGCGTGAFLAPGMIAIELEPTSARIAQRLHPEATVHACSFVDVRLPRDYADGAVGNLPFGDYTLTDPSHNPLGLSIHNHALNWLLAHVRPGGIIAVITSRWTLDSLKDETRREMAQHADLLGAIRLPAGAFAGSAGTQAVGDLLFLRVREQGNEPAGWDPIPTRIIPVEGGSARISNYFAQHPEQVLGTHTLISGQHGPELSVVANDLATLPGQVAEAAQRITTRARSAELTYSPVEQAQRAAVDAEADRIQQAIARFGHDLGAHEGSIIQEGNAFLTLREGQLVPFACAAAEHTELVDLLALRDRYRDLVDLQNAYPSQPQAVEQARAELNDSYDQYATVHGPLNRAMKSRSARWHFRFDPLGPAVMALEVYDRKSATANKSSIFQHDEQQGETPSRPGTAAEALAISLNHRGVVDLAYIAELLAVAPDEARARLGTLVFDDPKTGDHIPADRYLAGHVRSKLHLAESANRQAADDRFRANIDALKAVVPDDAEAGDIDIELGDPMLRPDWVEGFLRTLIGHPEIHVSRAVGGDWHIEADAKARKLSTNRETYGTAHWDALTIVERMLRRASLLVPPTLDKEATSSDPRDGKTPSTWATEDVQARADEINRLFADYMWEDPARGGELIRLYNWYYRSHLTYRPSGAHLTFPGLNPAITPRDYQKDAVARGLVESFLMEHDVGFGKTLSILMTVMKRKQLGLSRKPMIVVPNNALGQWERAVRWAYPHANVLICAEEDFNSTSDAAQTRARRQTFIGKIANGTFDAVIVPYTVFERIPLSAESQQLYLESVSARLRAFVELQSRGRSPERDVLEQELLNDLRDPMVAEILGEDLALAGIGDITDERPSARTVKRLRTLLTKLVEQLRRNALIHRDVGLPFERLGIDGLFVDEVQNFLGIAYPTRLRELGLSPAARAYDLDMKAWTVRRAYPDSAVIIAASGTPARNNMAQFYRLHELIKPDLLPQAAINDLDSFRGMFIATTLEPEIAPNGDIRFKERPGAFREANLNTYIRLHHIMADVRTQHDIKIDGRPVLAGGTPQIHVIPRTEGESAWMSTNWLGRIERFEAGEPDEGDIMPSIISDAVMHAIHPKLVGEEADGPTVLDAVVDNVLRIDLAYRDRRYRVDAKGPNSPLHPTPGAGQFIFCSLGVSNADNRRKGKWSAYDYMRDRLIAGGIPADKIGYMQDASGSSAKKEELLAKFRTGEIRVLIGSSGTAGVAVDAPDRAIAAHQVTFGWRPDEIEQEQGRLLRPGNQHRVAQVHQYVKYMSAMALRLQHCERKARFITQYKTGHIDLTQIDDMELDLNKATFAIAELKAMAAGKQLLLDKHRIDQKVRRLEAAESRWRRTREHQRTIIASADEVIASSQRRIDHIRELLARRDDPAQRGLRLDGRDAPATATDLRDLLLDRPSLELRNVATLNGVPLHVSKHPETGTAVITAEGVDHRLTVTVGSQERPASTATWLGRLGKLLTPLDAALQDAHDELAARTTSVERAHRLIDLPFDQAEALTSARAEQAHVAGLIAAEAAANTPDRDDNPRDTQEATDREMQDLVDSLLADGDEQETSTRRGITAAGGGGAPRSSEPDHHGDDSELGLPSDADITVPDLPRPPAVAELGANLVYRLTRTGRHMGQSTGREIAALLERAYEEASAAVGEDVQNFAQHSPQWAHRAASMRDALLVAERGADGGWTVTGSRGTRTTLTPQPDVPARTLPYGSLADTYLGEDAVLIRYAQWKLTAQHPGTRQDQALHAWTGTLTTLATGRYSLRDHGPTLEQVTARAAHFEELARLARTSAENADPDAAALAQHILDEAQTHLERLGRLVSDTALHEPWNNSRPSHLAGPPEPMRGNPWGGDTNKIHQGYLLTGATHTHALTGAELHYALLALKENGGRTRRQDDDNPRIRALTPTTHTWTRLDAELTPAAVERLQSARQATHDVAQRMADDSSLRGAAHLASYTNFRREAAAWLAVHPDAVDALSALRTGPSTATMTAAVELITQQAFHRARASMRPREAGRILHHHVSQWDIDPTSPLRHTAEYRSLHQVLDQLATNDTEQSGTSDLLRRAFLRAKQLADATNGRDRARAQEILTHYGWMLAASTGPRPADIGQSIWARHDEMAENLSPYPFKNDTWYEHTKAGGGLADLLGSDLNQLLAMARRAAENSPQRVVVRNEPDDGIRITGTRTIVATPLTEHFPALVAPHIEEVQGLLHTMLRSAEYGGFGQKETINQWLTTHLPDASDGLRAVVASSPRTEREFRQAFRVHTYQALIRAGQDPTLDTPASAPPLKAAPAPALTEDPQAQALVALYGRAAQHALKDSFLLAAIREAMPATGPDDLSTALVASGVLDWLVGGGMLSAAADAAALREHALHSLAAGTPGPALSAFFHQVWDAAVRGDYREPRRSQLRSGRIRALDNFVIPLRSTITADYRTANTPETEQAWKSAFRKSHPLEWATLRGAETSLLQADWACTRPENLALQCEGVLQAAHALKDFTDRSEWAQTFTAPTEQAVSTLHHLHRYLTILTRVPGSWEPVVRQEREEGLRRAEERQRRPGRFARAGERARTLRFDPWTAYRLDNNEILTGGAATHRLRALVAGGALVAEEADGSLVLHAKTDPYPIHLTRLTGEAALTHFAQLPHYTTVTTPADPRRPRFADAEAIAAHVRSGSPELAGPHDDGQLTDARRAHLEGLLTDGELVLQDRILLVRPAGGTRWHLYHPGTLTPLPGQHAEGFATQDQAHQAARALQQITDRDGHPFPWDAPLAGPLSRLWRSHDHRSLDDAVEHALASTPACDPQGHHRRAADERLQAKAHEHALRERDRADGYLLEPARRAFYDDEPGRQPRVCFPLHVTRALAETMGADNADLVQQRITVHATAFTRVNANDLYEHENDDGRPPTLSHRIIVKLQTWRADDGRSGTFTDTDSIDGPDALRPPLPGRFRSQPDVPPNARDLARTFYYNETWPKPPSGVDTGRPAGEPRAAAIFKRARTAMKSLQDGQCQSGSVREDFLRIAHDLHLLAAAYDRGEDHPRSGAFAHASASARILREKLLQSLRSTHHHSAVADHRLHPDEDIPPSPLAAGPLGGVRLHPWQAEADTPVVVTGSLPDGHEPLTATGTLRSAAYHVRVLESTEQRGTLLRLDTTEGSAELFLPERQLIEQLPATLHPALACPGTPRAAFDPPGPQPGPRSAVLNRPAVRAFRLQGDSASRIFAPATVFRFAHQALLTGRDGPRSRMDNRATWRDDGTLEVHYARVLGGDRSALLFVPDYADPSPDTEIDPGTWMEVHDAESIAGAANQQALVRLAAADPEVRSHLAHGGAAPFTSWLSRQARLGHPHLHPDLRTDWIAHPRYRRDFAGLGEKELLTLLDQPIAPTPPGHLAYSSHQALADARAHLDALASQWNQQAKGYVNERSTTWNKFKKAWQAARTAPWHATDPDGGAIPLPYAQLDERLQAMRRWLTSQEGTAARHSELLDGLDLLHHHLARHLTRLEASHASDITLNTALADIQTQAAHNPALATESDLSDALDACRHALAHPSADTDLRLDFDVAVWDLTQPRSTPEHLNRLAALAHTAHRLSHHYATTPTTSQPHRDIQTAAEALTGIAQTYAAHLIRAIREETPDQAPSQTLLASIQKHALAEDRLRSARDSDSWDETLDTWLASSIQLPSPLAPATLLAARIGEALPGPVAALRAGIQHTLNASAEPYRSSVEHRAATEFLQSAARSVLRARDPRGMPSEYRDYSRKWAAFTPYGSSKRPEDTQALSAAIRATQILHGTLSKSFRPANRQLWADLKIFESTALHQQKRWAASEVTLPADASPLTKAPLDGVAPYHRAGELRAALAQLHASWDQLHHAAMQPDMLDEPVHAGLFTDLTAAYAHARDILLGLPYAIGALSHLHDVAERLAVHHVGLADEATALGQLARSHALRTLATARNPDSGAPTLDALHRELYQTSLAKAPGDTVDAAALRGQIPSLVADDGLNRLLQRLQFTHPARLRAEAFLASWTGDSLADSEDLTLPPARQQYFYPMVRLAQVCADLRASLPDDADTASLEQLERHIGSYHQLVTGQRHSSARATAAPSPHLVSAGEPSEPAQLVAPEPSGRRAEEAPKAVGTASHPDQSLIIPPRDEQARRIAAPPGATAPAPAAQPTAGAANRPQPERHADPADADAEKPQDTAEATGHLAPPNDAARSMRSAPAPATPRDSPVPGIPRWDQPPNLPALVAEATAIDTLPGYSWQASGDFVAVYHDGLPIGRAERYTTRDKTRYRCYLGDDRLTQRRSNSEAAAHIAAVHHHLTGPARPVQADSLRIEHTPAHTRVHGTSQDDLEAHCAIEVAGQARAVYEKPPQGSRRRTGPFLYWEIRGTPDERQTAVDRLIAVLATRGRRIPSTTGTASAAQVEEPRREEREFLGSPAPENQEESQAPADRDHRQAAAEAESLGEQATRLPSDADAESARTDDAFGSLAGAQLTPEPAKAQEPVPVAVSERGVEPGFMARITPPAGVAIDRSWWVGSYGQWDTSTVGRGKGVSRAAVAFARHCEAHGWAVVLRAGVRTVDDETSEGVWEVEATGLVHDNRQGGRSPAVLSAMWVQQEGERRWDFSAELSGAEIGSRMLDGIKSLADFEHNARVARPIEPKAVTEPEADTLPAEPVAVREPAAAAAALLAGMPRNAGVLFHEAPERGWDVTAERRWTGKVWVRAVVATALVMGRAGVEEREYVAAWKETSGTYMAGQSTRGFKSVREDVARLLIANRAHEASGRTVWGRDAAEWVQQIDAAVSEISHAVAEAQDTLNALDGSTATGARAVELASSACREATECERGAIEARDAAREWLTETNGEDARGCASWRRVVVLASQNVKEAAQRVNGAARRAEAEAQAGPVVEEAWARLNAQEATWREGLAHTNQTPTAQGYAGVIVMFADARRDWCAWFEANGDPALSFAGQYDAWAKSRDNERTVHLPSRYTAAFLLAGDRVDDAARAYTVAVAEHVTGPGGDRLRELAAEFRRQPQSMKFAGMRKHLADWAKYPNRSGAAPELLAELAPAEWAALQTAQAAYEGVESFRDALVWDARYAGERAVKRAEAITQGRRGAEDGRRERDASGATEVAWAAAGERIAAALSRVKIAEVSALRSFEEAETAAQQAGDDEDLWDAVRLCGAAVDDVRLAAREAEFYRESAESYREARRLTDYLAEAERMERAAQSAESSETEARYLGDALEDTGKTIERREAPPEPAATIAASQIAPSAPSSTAQASPSADTVTAQDPDAAARPAALDAAPQTAAATVAQTPADPAAGWESEGGAVPGVPVPRGTHPDPLPSANFADKTRGWEVTYKGHHSYLIEEVAPDRWRLWRGTSYARNKDRKLIAIKGSQQAVRAAMVEDHKRRFPAMHEPGPTPAVPTKHAETPAVGGPAQADSLPAALESGGDRDWRHMDPSAFGLERRATAPGLPPVTLMPGQAELPDSDETAPAAVQPDSPAAVRGVDLLRPAAAPPAGGPQKEATAPRAAADVPRWSTGAPRVTAPADAEPLTAHPGYLHHTDPETGTIAVFAGPQLIGRSEPFTNSKSQASYRNYLGDDQLFNAQEAIAAVTRIAVAHQALTGPLPIRTTQNEAVWIEHHDQITRIHGSQKEDLELLAALQVSGTFRPHYSRNAGRKSFLYWAMSSKQPLDERTEAVERLLAILAARGRVLTVGNNDSPDADAALARREAALPARTAQGNARDDAHQRSSPPVSPADLDPMEAENGSGPLRTGPRSAEDAADPGDSEEEYPFPPGRHGSGSGLDPSTLAGPVPADPMDHGDRLHTRHVDIPAAEATTFQIPGGHIFTLLMLPEPLDRTAAAAGVVTDDIGKCIGRADELNGARIIAQAYQSEYERLRTADQSTVHLLHDLSDAERAWLHTHPTSDTAPAAPGATPAETTPGPEAGRPAATSTGEGAANPAPDHRAPRPTASFTDYDAARSHLRAIDDHRARQVLALLDLDEGQLTEDGNFILAKSTSATRGEGVRHRGRWYLLHALTAVVVSGFDGDTRRASALTYAKCLAAATGFQGETIRWADLTDPEAVTRARTEADASLESLTAQENDREAEAEDGIWAANRSAPHAFARRVDMLQYWNAGGRYSAGDTQVGAFMRYWSSDRDRQIVHLSADGQFAVVAFRTGFEVHPARDPIGLSSTRLTFNSRSRAEAFARHLAALRRADGTPVSWASPDIRDEVTGFVSDQGEPLNVAILRAYATTYTDGKGIPSGIDPAALYRRAADAAANNGAGTGRRLAEDVSVGDLLQGTLPRRVTARDDTGSLVRIRTADGAVNDHDRRDTLELFDTDADHARTATGFDNTSATRLYTGEVTAGDVVEFEAAERELTQLVNLEPAQIRHWNGRGTWRLVGLVNDAKGPPGTHNEGNGLSLDHVRAWRRQWSEDGSGWQEHTPGSTTLSLDRHQAPATVIRLDAHDSATWRSAGTVTQTRHSSSVVAPDPADQAPVGPQPQAPAPATDRNLEQEQARNLLGPAFGGFTLHARTTLDSAEAADQFKNELARLLDWPHPQPGPLLLCHLGEKPVYFAALDHPQLGRVVDMAYDPAGGPIARVTRQSLEAHPPAVLLHSLAAAAPEQPLSATARLDEAALAQAAEGLLTDQQRRLGEQGGTRRSEPGSASLRAQQATAQASAHLPQAGPTLPVS